jgi:hypothetical protein
MVRWWAQISLVRLTGQNFGQDWKVWGAWWNTQKGQPPFHPEMVRWWNGQQQEWDKLEVNSAKGDRKFIAGIKKISTAAAAPAN